MQTIVEQFNQVEHKIKLHLHGFTDQQQLLVSCTSIFFFFFA